MNLFDKGLPHIFGINPIAEILKKDGHLKSLYIQKNVKNERVEKLIQEAKDQKIQFHFVDDFFFSSIEHQNHQGIVGVLKEKITLLESIEAVEDFLFAKDKAVVLLLDKITDPHNLGAISRSAYFFGVDLIIMEKKDSPPIEATVHKVSSGASLLMTYAKVGSLRLMMESLRQNQFKCYIASSQSPESQSLTQTQFQFPMCLVLGSEGSGVRRNLIEKEDILLNIQGKRPFDSLNVSNATAVILSKVIEQSN